jgi:hypothetical protein
MSCVFTVSFSFSAETSLKCGLGNVKQLTSHAVLVAGFSDPYCLLGLVSAESEIRSLDSLSNNSGVLSREASLELQQDGGTIAVSSITVMAGTMGDSKTITQRLVPVMSSYV